LHAAYILVGGYGAFAFLLTPKHLINRFKLSVDLLVPYWFLSTYFLPVVILYLHYDYLSPILVAQFGEQFGWGRTDDYFIISRDQEAVEFILALGFLLFVEINRRRLALGRLDTTVSAKS
jgi:hypothetical protein